MKSCLSLLSIMSVVFGHPEPPSPYQYNSLNPSGSYGAPAPQYAAPAPQYTAAAPIQSPVIEKHFYFHELPPEPEHTAPRQQITLPPQHKNYNILFINAPSPPVRAAPVIPIQPQIEEKTIVYVLANEPEQQPEIVIPTPQPTPPSKPEVYFIDYKTQKQQIGHYQQNVDPAPYGDYGANPLPSRSYGLPNY